MQISAPILLFFIFLVLKLCHFIAWSWWWVTAPLWFGIAIVGIIFLIPLGGMVAGLIATVFYNKLSK